MTSAIPLSFQQAHDHARGVQRLRISAADGINVAEWLKQKRVKAAAEAVRAAAEAAAAGGAGLPRGTAPSATVSRARGAPSTEGPEDPVTAESPGAASTARRADYAFPAVHPVPHPEDHLSALMSIYRRSGKYSDIREQFCAASVALNTVGLRAPAFRDQPQPRPKAAGTGRADLQLHRDRVVIDMHWLWARRVSEGTAKAPYATLLDADAEFDFELASAFAAENWTSHERATEKLSLSYTVQWQLATVKSVHHAETHRMILDGGRDEGKRVPSRASRVAAAIADWAEQNHRIRGHERVYLNLWVAREMLASYKSGDRIGRLAGLMAGTTPLERSTVRRKLDALDDRLAR